MQNKKAQFNVDPVSRPAISQRQFWVVLVATVLLVSLLSVIYFLERNKERRLRVEQSIHRLTLAQEIIARDLNRVRSDLLFVATLPEVQLANSADPTSRKAAVKVFQDFVKTQTAYSQIRLIDRNGMEVARVDWNGTESIVTTDAELQDKSDRYYFTDSLGLSVNQIFTSEFDLNLEQGEIEKPAKPVIRFVTPVLQDGHVGNLLVFNYQGAPLLRELSEISLPGKTYLIRSDGEFLLGPSPASEWGWLLEHSNRFSTTFQTVDVKRLTESTSSILSREGLFQAKRIKLYRDSADSNVSRLPLYFLAHIPVEEVFQTTRQLLNRLLLVGGIMLVPLALITRFWALAVDRRAWQNQKIADSEKRLRQLSAQLVGLQEEERRSLSREFHDSLGQQATAINLDLRMLKETMTDQSGLDRVIRESDELLSSLHGFATRVRPAELDDLGIREALESHVWDFESRTGIECSFECQFENEAIDPAIGVHVFRIVQEALNNIAKHANADIASVHLGFNDSKNELQLFIADDGVGMGIGPPNSDFESETEKRLGVLGMRERVELLGGVLSLESSVGSGTKLKVRIPIPCNFEVQNEEMG